MKATLANKDVLEMFQGVLGTSEGSLNPEIIYPKYLKMKDHVERFLKVMKMMATAQFMTFFPEKQSFLSQYYDSLHRQFEEVFNVPDYTGKEIPDKFKEQYSFIKKSNIINIIIVACNNLTNYKKHLIDIDRLNPRFF